MGGAVAAAAAVTAIGTAAFNVSRETEAATANIAAQLGTTIEEAERFGEVAQRVYGENFAGSVTEAGEAVGRAFQVMGDLGDKSLQKVTERAFALRDSFQVDTAESIDAAQTLMENFGISSDQAFDLIAKGFQKGLNRADDFTDTINEYSTQFASGGATAAQFFNLLESGLAGGALGVDKAADAFKEFRVRIQDGSKATADSLSKLFGTSGQYIDNLDEIANGEKALAKLRDELQLTSVKQSEFTDKTKEFIRLKTSKKIAELTGKIKEQEAALFGLNSTNRKFTEGTKGIINYQGGMSKFLEDMASGSISASDAFQMIIGGLNEVEDANLRMQLGVGLLGTQFEDLGDSALSLSLVGDQFADIEGAADSLNAKYQNFGDLWGALWRKTAVAVSPLTDELLKMANDAMPSVSEKISEMVDTGVKGVLSLKQAWDDDFGGIRSSLEKFQDDLIRMKIRALVVWQDMKGPVAKFQKDIEPDLIRIRIRFLVLWEDIRKSFTGSSIDTEWRTFWGKLTEDFFEWTRKQVVDLEKTMADLRTMLAAGMALMQGDWGKFWEEFFKLEPQTLTFNGIPIYDWFDKHLLEPLRRVMRTWHYLQSLRNAGEPTGIQYDTGDPTGVDTNRVGTRSGQTTNVGAINFHIVAENRAAARDGVLDALRSAGLA